METTYKIEGHDLSSKHLIHDELIGIVDLLPEIEFNVENLQEIRANLLDRFNLISSKESTSEFDEIETREYVVPGLSSSPDIRIIVYTPKIIKKSMPAFFHIHGGGYVLGTPEMVEERNKKLAIEVECVVITVDYRLAPETPYPGPIEDCYTALKWVHQNAKKLNINQNEIAVGGESAGGGLSACLSILARDREEVPILFQLLIYPMLDDRTCVIENPNSCFGEYVWTPPSNYFGWESMLGHKPGLKNVDSYVAAAREEDLSGLPPTYIGVGSVELFLEESIEYARRLMASGVITELHVIPGAFHAFDSILPEAEVSKEFERSYFFALKQAFTEY